MFILSYLSKKRQNYSNLTQTHTNNNYTLSSEGIDQNVKLDLSAVKTGAEVTKKRQSANLRPFFIYKESQNFSLQKRLSITRESSWRQREIHKFGKRSLPKPCQNPPLVPVSSQFLEWGIDIRGALEYKDFPVSFYQPITTQEFRPRKPVYQRSCDGP